MFGRGLDPAKCVFVNCPFDPEYRPLFDAIMLAVVCCGFTPRSAMESGTVSKPRVERIVEALKGGKYSIHDLSRCTGEGPDNLARFNMPLELGMAMARRFMDPGGEHDWLVMVPKGHVYARFVSDLAAYDPVAHDGSKAGVVAAVMSWLTTRPDAVPTASPKEILDLLPTFERALSGLYAEWGGVPPWTSMVLSATETAKELS